MARARYPENWRATFLATLALTANVRVACAEAGISRATAYRQKARSPKFKKDWDTAIEDAVDRLRQEAWQRGVAGVDRPVFQGGAQVGVVREYSDTLLLSLLKAHAPEQFRERYEVRTTSDSDVDERIKAGLEQLERLARDGKLKDAPSGHPG